MKGSLLIFFGCLLHAQVRGPSTEMGRALGAAHEHLDKVIQGFNERQHPSMDGLRQALDRLKQAVAHATEIRIDPFEGRSIQLEAKTRALFGRSAILPREDKQNGHWTFEPVRFSVVPMNLYTYGLTFRATRTIRIREVRLYFRDGTRTVHDAWAQLDGGNGKVFEKREYLPMLHAYRETDRRQARLLEAVEIVGSAQDGNLTAELSFLLEVPDPAAPALREAKSRAAELAHRYGVANPDAALLNRCQRDLKLLAELIGLPYVIDAVARD